jgi:outer membrane protein
VLIVSALKHKKLIVILLLIVLAVLGSASYKIWKASTSHNLRHSVPEAHIALVNMPHIRNEASAFIAFRDLIERQYKIFHNEIIELETNLRERYALIKEKELNHQTLPKDLKQAKDQLDKEVSKLEKTIRQRKEKLAQDFETINQEIETKLQEILKRIAHERHLNLVFNATTIGDSVVLFGGKELDISEEIISKLNKELPTVHLPS